MFSHMPACVEGMVAPSDPREAGPADFPMVVAGRTSSKMEERAQTHLDHSKDHLLYQDLHSSFLGPADHSTSPHGCSKEGKVVVAGLDQKEAGEEPRQKGCDHDLSLLVNCKVRNCDD